MRILQPAGPECSLAARGSLALARSIDLSSRKLASQLAKRPASRGSDIARLRRRRRQASRRLRSRITERLYLLQKFYLLRKRLLAWPPRKPLSPPYGSRCGRSASQPASQAAS